LVGRGRLVEPFGPLVVAGDQPPVRLTARGAAQRVGHPGVQPSPNAWRCQFGGDLPQQFMAKPPNVGAPWLEHRRGFEFGDDLVELILAEVDDRAQQATIHLAADDGGRLHHGHHFCGCAQPRIQRLIQCLGYSGLAEIVDDLFDVKRQPVTPADHHRPRSGGQRRSQRGGQRVALLGLGSNAQHRCQQWHQAVRIQRTGQDLGIQESQPFGLIGEPSNAAPAL